MVLKCINVILLATGSVTARAQFSQINIFLLNQVQLFHIPAVSVAIIDNGKVVLSKAYGTANFEYNIPNTSGTPFQLASATKFIAATAPKTLVQEGKLDLQQKVRKVRASVIEP